MGIENLKRAFLVKEYYELKSSRWVIKAWKNEYPNIKRPSPSTVIRTVSRFEELKVNMEREI